MRACRSMCARVVVWRVKQSSPVPSLQHKIKVRTRTSTDPGRKVRSFKDGENGRQHLDERYKHLGGVRAGEEGRYVSLRPTLPWTTMTRRSYLPRLKCKVIAYFGWPLTSVSHPIPQSLLCGVLRVTGTRQAMNMEAGRPAGPLSPHAPPPLADPRDALAEDALLWRWPPCRGCQRAELGLDGRRLVLRRRWCKSAQVLRTRRGTPNGNVSEGHLVQCALE